jgi:hypothetical protein
VRVKEEYERREMKFNVVNKDVDKLEVYLSGSLVTMRRID